MKHDIKIVDGIPTTTKRYDAEVPDEVLLEVRRNMAQEGWKYAGLTQEVEPSSGKTLNVQTFKGPKGVMELPEQETENAG